MKPLTEGPTKSNVKFCRPKPNGKEGAPPPPRRPNTNLAHKKIQMSTSDPTHIHGEPIYPHGQAASTPTPPWAETDPYLTCEPARELDSMMIEFPARQQRYLEHARHVQWMHDTLMRIAELYRESEALGEHHIGAPKDWYARRDVLMAEMEVLLPKVAAYAAHHNSQNP